MSLTTLQTWYVRVGGLDLRSGAARVFHRNSFTSSSLHPPHQGFLHQLSQSHHRTELVTVILHTGALYFLAE
jgi:hypothetical protein